VFLELSSDILSLSIFRLLKSAKFNALPKLESLLKSKSALKLEALLELEALTEFNSSTEFKEFIQLEHSEKPEATSKAINPFGILKHLKLYKFYKFFRIRNLFKSIGILFKSMNIIDNKRWVKTFNIKGNFLPVSLYTGENAIRQN
jgi:hypothetical protein